MRVVFTYNEADGDWIIQGRDIPPVMEHSVQVAGQVLLVGVGEVLRAREITAQLAAHAEVCADLSDLTDGEAE